MCGGGRTRGGRLGPAAKKFIDEVVAECEMSEAARNAVASKILESYAINYINYQWYIEHKNTSAGEQTEYQVIAGHEGDVAYLYGKCTKVRTRVRRTRVLNNYLMKAPQQEHAHLCASRKGDFGSVGVIIIDFY